MNRKSMLFCILILILGISLLAGCGGGGKKDDPITQGPSSDFMGIEVGAVKTYNCIENEVDTGNFSRKVLAEVEPGVFKIGFIYPGETEMYSGDYIGIDGNTYYIRGDWDNTEEPPDDDNLLPTPNGIYVINPIPNGFISDDYGTLVGKETITTPAGKFEAYKFHSHGESPDGGASWTEDDYTWFVPYLGEVMGYYEETENGVVISKNTLKIISY